MDNDSRSCIDSTDDCDGKSTASNSLSNLYGSGGNCRTLLGQDRCVVFAKKSHTCKVVAHTNPM
jgi:hypothetical protein